MQVLLIVARCLVKINSIRKRIYYSLKLKASLNELAIQRLVLFFVLAFFFFSEEVTSTFIVFIINIFTKYKVR